jgi:undecaprenyl phosphate-alpha-L-ara4FN deformylase
MRRTAGLRIDVDTLAGFGKGVRPLVGLLNRFSVRATFFVVTGWDHPLRGVPRLISERGFARRVFRLRKSIGRVAFGMGETAVKDSIKAIRDGGHELALHGFHHFSWQLHVKEWVVERISTEIKNARQSYTLLTGGYPEAFAAPGWETSDGFFIAEDSFGFKYASDTRGASPFYPLVLGKRMSTLQVPVTLPTIDELIALGQTQKLVDLTVKDGDVYCAHAEFDGMAYLPLFERFLSGSLAKGLSFVPLSDIAMHAKNAPSGVLDYRTVPGRTARVACQKPPLKPTEMQC